MSELMVGADAASPFAYKVLPAGVSIILGYLGGDTPHPWTSGEVKAAEATGRLWCGIWTAPSTGQHLTSATGTLDGLQAATRLHELGRPKGLPVFYDIEHASYIANPPGALAARDGFRAELLRNGYPRAYAYLPAAAGQDWVANWTYERPTALPAGVVGWQYTGPAFDTRFDLSVFDAALFSQVTTSGGDSMATWDNDDKAYLVKQLQAVQTNIGTKLSAYQYDNDKANPEPAANIHLHEQLTELSTAVGKIGAGGIDVAALAHDISAALAPAIGAAVATELAKRLAQ